VGPRAILEAVVKRKIPTPSPNRTQLNTVPTLHYTLERISTSDALRLTTQLVLLHPALYGV